MLVHGKALHLLSGALAQLPPEVPYELRILGDGPLRDRWQRLARRLGVAPHLNWLGRLPHQEALRQYAWADLFVFTSLRDTSGNVVVEAWPPALPVLCLDHQGMHDIVTDGLRREDSGDHAAGGGRADSPKPSCGSGGTRAEWGGLSRGAIRRAEDSSGRGRSRRWRGCIARSWGGRRFNAAGQQPAGV